MASTTLHFRTTVLPGHRIEITVPDIPEGQGASVFVVVDVNGDGKRPLWESIGDYSGGQLFRSAAEVDTYLKAERESWDN